MDSLISYQEELYSNLRKAITNFKKSPKERITVLYVEGRLELLEQIWSDFSSGHKNLMQSITPAQKKDTESNYFKDSVFDEAQELYFEYKLELKNKLTSLVEPSIYLSPSASNQSNNNRSGKSCNVKLPKINIPMFTGKYSEWSTFRDLFISLIHTNNDLDDVQKLLYLKGYVSGEAEQLLANIPTTEINYKRCWKLLEERYDNKRYISNYLLRKLLSQKNIVHESASSLKELMDTTNDCLAALANIGVQTDTWDLIVIHIITLKLDPESRRQWEFNASESNASDKLPTYKQFQDFITKRYRAIEFLDSKSNVRSQYTPVNKMKSMHITNVKCAFCADEHRLNSCKKFHAESVDSRRNFVQTNGLCYCCLGSNHAARNCLSSGKCRICNKKHHVLLHPTGKGGLEGQVSNRHNSTTQNLEPSSSVNNADKVVSCFSAGEYKASQVLLATVLVETSASNGQRYMVRALLDQGSQSSFVTEATVQTLGLKKLPIKSTVSGVGGDNSLISKAMVKMEIRSRVDPKVVINVKAYVLRAITTLLPTERVKLMEWPELKQISLADPEFGTPSRVDLLLGAEVYSTIIQEGVKRSPVGSVVVQSTTLGWIISGAVESSGCQPKIINTLHCKVNDVTDILKKFWELEESVEMPKEKLFTENEKRCEKYYAETTTRDDQGRYIVRLPFNSDEPEVSKSKVIAEKRLKSLEKRLKNENLKEKYEQVIHEYLELDHMELIPEGELKNERAIYLPHHAVVRDDKETTKVRAVFDASCKGTNEKSLNDNLLVGPRLQPELRHIVLRWRIRPICLTADIVQMFRQVIINEADRDVLRILWRNDEKAEINHYRMKRVTFGLASSPYLAVKTLQQLATDEGSEYPLAAERVIVDYYMDDLMSGCETKEEGLRLYKEMSELLAKGGFKLQKWASNNQELLKEIGEIEESKVGKRGNTGKENKKDLRVKTDEVIKIVGLTWNRSDDFFSYKVEIPVLLEPVTKRKIIADISRFYDPLGWVGPSIIISKIMMQKLWLTGLEWDEEVPKNIVNEWLTYREELKELCNIAIPRWIGTNIMEDEVELHGFCDASKDAYAAVIYCRVVKADGRVQVALLSAKTKVAPVKQVSIPRLELCGAVLVTRLLMEVATVMNVDKSRLHAWTDSTVVLAWLNGHPNRWKVFVANRVSEIMSNLDPHHWSHVTSKNNPADAASRGQSPNELGKNLMWFQGPDFLKSEHIEYQRPKDISTNLEEVKIKSHFATRNFYDDIMERFSSLSKVIRVIAYCQRFLQNSKKATIQRELGYLTTNELKRAMNHCIIQCQNENFNEELEILRKKQNLPKRSCLRALNPFLDEDQIVRVGGRLENTMWSRERRHPILLPRRSRLTDLIVDDAHKRTLHGGPQLMLCYLQSRFWILGVKQLVKSHFKKCVICVKSEGKSQTQLMGQLPHARVTPSRPFKSSGVDYAGPILIRTAKGRGHKSHKAYICLFVCMVTRAIHLEVVTDLTTQGFLQAFKRFVARRGYCSDIWSDNGTNFVGAAKELKRLFIDERGSLSNEIAEALATNNCTWHFIPSRSPNFGGLWEAGVKSVKYHLKRVVGQSTLTYEEFSTVLAQIEACLNSRPLSVITENEHSTILTPGHFLVGEALVTPPDSDFQSSNLSSLRRWQYTQRMVQDFWRQWSRQYLNKYFLRYRWSERNPEPKVNDIVIVKEDNLPTCRWLYGKVISTHPGQDNITRVVTLKVKNGIIKRPISKVCLLPV